MFIFQKNQDESKISARDFGADIVRIYAVFMVLTLHYFLRNGFYYREMTGFWGILTMTIRSISLCCVPLFLMLSGYLKYTKEWTISYYRSLFPILTSYTMISFLHLIYKICVQGEEKSAAEWLRQFLDFKLANYGWYVGMYIGLFLLIPLFNLVWAGCKNQKQHILAAATLCAVTFLPASVNLLSETNLLPAYFTKMYYISYYFIGAYIRTYRPKVKQGILWGSGLLIGAGISLANILTRTDPANFYTGFSASYDHLLTAALATCIFLSLYQIDCKKVSIRTLASKFSAISLEIYLCSYLFDSWIFQSFSRNNPTFMYLPIGIWMIPAVFAGSTVIALPIHRISRVVYSKMR